MTEPQQTTVQTVIDKYSPITNGRKGLLGFALKALAKPLEIAANTLGAVEQWAFPTGYPNTAGQILLNTSSAIASTYQRMESKLRASFNKASSKNAAPADREQFLGLASEVKQDAAVLAPHATVLRSAFDIVNEPYKFIVLQGAEGAESTTLEQGIATVTAAQERKNPVTIRRNPQPYPKPATGTQAQAG